MSPLPSPGLSLRAPPSRLLGSNKGAGAEGGTQHLAQFPVMFHNKKGDVGKFAPNPGRDRIALLRDSGQHIGYLVILDVADDRFRNVLRVEKHHFRVLLLGNTEQILQ